MGRLEIRLKFWFDLWLFLHFLLKNTFYTLFGCNLLLSDNKDNKLTDYVKNVEVNFASQKKMEILANAKKLLLQCDFVIPQMSLLGSALLLLWLFSCVSSNGILFRSR